jgi:ABC-type transporter Mla MlaB component
LLNESPTFRKFPKSRELVVPASFNFSIAYDWRSLCFTPKEKMNTESDFKIERSSNGKSVVFTVSGRIEAAALTELQKLLKDEAGDHNVALDLKGVSLVDRAMVLFLASCSSMRPKRISSTRHLEPKDMKRRALKASEVRVAVEGKNMSEILQSKSDIPFEDSIPEAGASLESILCTEELQRRPSRPPDYERENCALVALVSALADSPSTVLQALAETILDITQCDSAGLSLLTRMAKGRTLTARGFIGQLSPACGIRTSEVGPRAISALAETYLIKIVLCCSDISSGVTPISYQSRL